MPSDDLLQRALDGAFVVHFGKLFETLLAQPYDSSAFDRFVKGLTLTCETFDQIEKEIKTWE